MQSYQGMFIGLRRTLNEVGNDGMQINHDILVLFAYTRVSQLVFTLITHLTFLDRNSLVQTKQQRGYSRFGELCPYYLRKAYVEVFNRFRETFPVCSNRVRGQVAKAKPHALGHFEDHA